MQGVVGVCVFPWWRESSLLFSILRTHLYKCPGDENELTYDHSVDDSSASCRPQAGSSIPWKCPTPPSSPAPDAVRNRQQDTEVVVHLNTAEGPGAGRVPLLGLEGPTCKAPGHWKQGSRHVSSPALPAPCLEKLMPADFFRDPSGNCFLVSPFPDPGNSGMVERALI